MKQTFFARWSLCVLMAVFFTVPFALRGSRLALDSMQNDVKDWLPASFDETAELDWFREHFLGEQFVVVSWEGCTGSLDDTRFRLLMDKFFPEVPPSKRTDEEDLRAGAGFAGPNARQPGRVDAADEQAHVDETLGLYTRQLRPDDLGPESEHIGNRLGLRAGRDYYEDWGGLKERWLRGETGDWYYILPKGELYRWHGGSTPMNGLFRSLYRRVTGTKGVAGELVAEFGPADGPWYYNDPRRLEAHYFKSVVTGPSVLHELTRGEGLRGIDRDEAQQRLQGVLFGPDGKQTCMMASLTDVGERNKRLVVGRGLLGKPRGKLLDMAEESGIKPPPRPSFVPPRFAWLVPNKDVVEPPIIKLGGPAVDNVAIDEEGQITLVRLVGLSVLIGLILSWVSFRSVQVTIMVFMVGGISAVTSLSIVWWVGSSVDAVLMSMPSVVYVLGISGAVHIVNYYRDAVESNGLEGAPERALKLGWQPCMLAALTTSLGLISLVASNIVPIQKFGLFSAIGVIATLVMLFAYLPAALQSWPPGYHLRRQAAESPKKSRLHKVTNNFWLSVGRFVIRRNGWVTAVGVVVLVVFTVGVTRINTSIQLLKLFDGQAKIITDYEWLETHLGKLVPIELVVRVQPGVIRSDGASDDKSEEENFGLNFLERMEITSHVKEAIDAEFGPAARDIVGQAMQASTFAPPLPKAGGGSRAAIARGTYSRQLEAHRPQFLATDYLRVDQETDAELWRISLRLGALNDVDYGEFVHELKSAVEPVMAAYRYRDSILRAIDEQRKKQGKRGFRGAYVCVLGAPSLETILRLPESTEESSDSVGGNPLPDGLPVNDEAASASRVAGGGARIDQTAIFARTLYALLTNAAVRISGWHDPADELPEGWTRALAASECVVLVGDDAKYDSDLIRQNAPLLIDARDHRFEPQPTSPVAADDEPLISTVYTGVVPVVYKAQRTLLESLIQSTGWAFVMIAVVMMVLLRSFRAGLISMLPNLMPVVVIFGYMGWSRVLVDIGSMMTASVALGVAVDDTIHFLTWFRRGLDQGRDRKGAIMLAYKRVATAMTQTTAIGGLGLSVFAFSTFTPTQRFGVLMFTLLVAALIGDLIFLPALLAGPLGKAFGRKASPGATTQPASSSTSSAKNSRRTESAHASKPRAGDRAAIMRHDAARNPLQS
jgi:predicted RND superfamily exporter protein